MQITINGEHREVPAPCTVQSLLAQRRLSQGACAVEVNRRLVPKRRHDEVQLREGDEVEIVMLVGGG